MVGNGLVVGWFVGWLVGLVGCLVGGNIIQARGIQPYNPGCFFGSIGDEQKTTLDQNI